MDFDPVDSSMIDALGYDPDKQHLGVRFKSGKVVTYGDVPPEVHDALRSADSVGKHFHATIAGQYDPVD